MDRDELHRRVVLLKEELDAGRLRIREGLQVIDSLRKVRFAPDGKVDPLSVDGAVRALALGAEYGRFRREAKKIPLRESQSEYFEILDKFFGKPFAEMKKNNLTPPDVAQHLASTPRMVEAFAADAQEFATGIKEFWDYYGPIIEMHLQDMQALKSVFGGDIFPSYQANLATSLGLYVDTLILPDPLLRTVGLLGHMKPDRLLFFTAKHALNALQYKDLALAELDPPIVVIAPDPSYREEPYLPILRIAGETDLLSHSAKLFGKQFGNLNELEMFLSELTDSQALIAKISDPSRLLFDTEWSGSLEQQIHRYLEDFSGDFGPGMNKEPVGKVIQLALLGRMMQANDTVLKASRLHGNPLIDAPTSWRYLLWKYEYEGRSHDELSVDFRDVLISKVISVEGSTRFGLLSGLPSEVLIELRRLGALVGLRELMRKGIQNVDSASESSLAEVGEAVVANLCDAFAEHRKQLSELSSERRKFYGYDVGRWIAFGGVSIGAAAAGNPSLAVLAAVLSMIGAPQAGEIARRWKEVRSQKESLQRSPTGILFRHLDRARKS